jgi:C1A family cysteine protease
VVRYRFDDNHVNWDKSLGAVGFLNSWGTEWGVKVDPTRKEAGGSGWLPYTETSTPKAWFSICGPNGWQRDDCDVPTPKHQDSNL